MVAPPPPALDPRFSDPDARATTWEHARCLLEAAELFWVTTVRKDGRPHTVPLVAVWLDDRAYFCTGADEQKAVNLARDPHVTLVTGCNCWEEGLDLVVEGEAIRVTEQALLERLAQAWKRKWDGRWQYQVADRGFQQGGHVTALVFEVRPAKVLAFGKGTFSQTRHQF
jgi:general stress protein 26